MRTRPLTLACFAFVLTAVPVAAQPAMPKPGPEHALLKKFVGDWDATVSMMGQESKGTSHNRIALGGFWLLTDFHADLGGIPFAGRGTTGYDPARKHYVGTWIDSMSPGLTLTHGSFDAGAKTYTERGTGPGEDGKPTKIKAVTQFPDDDTMIFTMYNVADDKDQEVLKITYKRKK